MIRPVARGVKALLPKGMQYRKLPFGLAAGCTVAVDPEHNLKTYLGLYEYELLPHLKRMLKRGSNCFDIGGRNGYYALLLARTSRGRVASFEFDPEAVEEMERTFAHNPSLQIQVVKAYVGAEDGNGRITIDTASRELFAPDMIKMDIEGGEDEALEGALETLAKHRPSLIIEVHAADKEDKCITLLRSFNYAVKIVDQKWFLKDVYRRLAHNRWLAAYPL